MPTGARGCGFAGCNLGVLWRKNAFGCHSAAGCRFVERMLTVVQTLRLQNRPVLDYLHRAIVAHRAGLLAPQLLSQAGHLNGYDQKALTMAQIIW